MRARHRTARDAFAAEHARRLAAALLEPAHERLMRMKAEHAGGVADRILRFDQISMRERSEEHTSELQSLMRPSYAGCSLKKTQQTCNAMADQVRPTMLLGLHAEVARVVNSSGLSCFTEA